jgi:hypothetical protein
MVGAILAVGVASTRAGEIKVDITAVHVVMPSESDKLSDGRTMMHVHDKAIVQAADPNSPLNLASRNCYGTMIMDAKGNPVDGAGYCETIDKANDTYWLTWNMAPGGIAWKAFHGTGKYEGVTGGGDTKVIAWYADRYVISSEGTLMVK